MKTVLTLFTRLLIFTAAVAVIALSVRFFSGSEDTWLCKDGEWVAHGSPTQPKPTTPCPANAEPITEKTKNQETASFAKEGFLVVNSDRSWGLVYTEKEKPNYELGSTVLQMDPTSICFAPNSDIGQPCARVTWQPGAQASLIGEVLRPGLTKVMQMRIISPKSSGNK